MKRVAHRSVVFAALSVACLGAPAACRRETAEEVESETVVTVKTAPATVGAIRGVIHATGLVSPAPGAELVVVAPEAARIAEIPHAAGERVRRGDVLVRFEIPSAAAEVQRQKAEIARAEATLDSTRAGQTRARELFERGVAARKEVEESNRSVADAEAALAVARASLRAAETVAARATVRATFDGVVAKRSHNPGDLVEPSASDPVLRVVDPLRLEVIAAVPLGDSSRIRMGAAAHGVTAPLDATSIGLKVLSQPAAVEAGTATVPVRLGFSTPVTIPVGTPVQLDIDAEQHSGVVLIPAVALVREGEATAVFVVREGQAQRRDVEVGLTDGRNVEIVSGIRSGERVVIDGQAGLPDNAKVSEAAAATGHRPGDSTDKDPGK